MLRMAYKLAIHYYAKLVWGLHLNTFINNIAFLNQISFVEKNDMHTKLSCLNAHII